MEIKTACHIFLKLKTENAELYNGEKKIHENGEKKIVNVRLHYIVIKLFVKWIHTNHSLNDGLFIDENELIFINFSTFLVLEKFIH